MQTADHLACTLTMHYTIQESMQVAHAQLEFSARDLGTPRGKVMISGPVHSKIRGVHISIMSSSQKCEDI